MIGPNSFFDPFTAARPRNGLFAIGTLIVPIGVLLGLAPRLIVPIANIGQL